MKFKELLLIIFAFLILVSIASCGGGSSGTAIGSSGGDDRVNFSGIVVSKDGTEIQSAEVILLNTDDATQTNEAGAFDLSANFPGGDATLEVKTLGGKAAELTLPSLPLNSNDVALSIVYDANAATASSLDLTLRARIVRNCSPLFLNTITIRQKAAVPEGLICTIEAELKSKGLPVNDLLFQLEYRGCAKNDSWKFLDVGKFGTSGEGVGELDFKFRNDENHCVYRIRGPLDLKGTFPLTVQLHTLRKIEFDDSH